MPMLMLMPMLMQAAALHITSQTVDFSLCTAPPAVCSASIPVCFQPLL
jgi:hypothetical protein